MKLEPDNSAQYQSIFLKEQLTKSEETNPPSIEQPTLSTFSELIPGDRTIRSSPGYRKVRFQVLAVLQRINIVQLLSIECAGHVLRPQGKDWESSASLTYYRRDARSTDRLTRFRTGRRSTTGMKAVAKPRVAGGGLMRKGLLRLLTSGHSRIYSQSASRLTPVWRYQ
jgi:hypothetical protein